MYKLLWVKAYFKKLLICILIVMLLSLAGILIYSKILQVQYVQSIPDTMLYYQGPDIEKLITEDVDYQLTVPLYTGDRNLDVPTAVYPLKNKVPLVNLQFNNETTPALAHDISEKINGNNLEYAVNAAINYSGDWINDTALQNESLGIDHVIAGNYPLTSDEVMIPEAYALYYIETNDLDTYSDVIGHQIELIDENNSFVYKVSGVYYGPSTDFIINLPAKWNDEQEQIEYQALFLKFDTKLERNQFLDNHEGYDFIQSEDFKLQRLRNVSIYIYEGLIIITFLLFMYPEIKDYRLKLNHYYYSLSTSLFIIIPLIVMMLVGLQVLNFIFI